MRENVTKIYKKSNFNKVRNINNKAKKITENLPVADRIDTLQEKETYIMKKDHKDEKFLKIFWDSKKGKF